MLPPATANALDQAVRAAYTDAMAALAFDATSSADVWQVVLAVVHTALQDCAIRHNEAVPHIAHLPNELLTDIFETLPLRDRITTSHVCRAWRTVSLGSSAQLWNRIDKEDRPHVLAARLERSGTALLELSEVAVAYKTAGAISQCLAPHMAHIRTLTLRLEDEFETATLNAALCQPAPELVDFTLIDDGVNDLYLPETLFAGHAPQLVSATFTMPYGSIAGCRALSALLHLTFTTRILGPEAWEAIFGTCQQLERLDVHMTFFDATGYTGQRNEANRIEPPRTLKQLQFFAFDDDSTAEDDVIDVAAAFSYIEHTLIPDITVTLRRQVANFVHVLAPNRPTSMTVSSTNDAFNVTLATATQSRSYFGLFPLPDGFDVHGFTPRMVAHVTHLTLDSLDQLGGLAPPTLPSLTTLSIEWLPKYCRFSAVPLRVGLLDCPELDTICVSAHSTLSPEDVTVRARILHKILTSVVLFERKISVLEIRRVVVVEDRALLDELADEVKYIA